MIILLLILNQYLSKKYYECTQGIDPKTLSHKKYLMEFSKGPCAPVIIVPALFSTKLQVKIDCPVLLEKNRKIFEQCGWNACEK